MAYNPPTFNLLFNLWRSPGMPGGTPKYTDVPCQLYCPKQYGMDIMVAAQPTWVMPVYLRVPKRTDVMFDASFTTIIDRVEVPAGSGRHYAVRQVEDVHKGFPNEYRLCLLHPIPPWPNPIP